MAEVGIVVTSFTMCNDYVVAPSNAKQSTPAHDLFPANTLAKIAAKARLRRSATR